MLASEILSKVAMLLQDEQHVRWPLPELCEWLNDGLRAIVLAKPSASSTSVVIELIAGTLQSLAASHLLLLRLPRNITSAAATVPRVGGRAIRLVAREQLDTSAPDWHAHDQKAEVRQYVYDEANPREFYVYPPNDGDGKVEAVVSVMPELIAIEENDDPAELDSYEIEIDLPEPYGVPLQDFILFRAFAKDDIAGNSGRSAGHYRLFADAVGLKISVEGSSSPNSRARVASA